MTILTTKERQLLTLLLKRKEEEIQDTKDWIKDEEERLAQQMEELSIIQGLLDERPE